MAQPSRAGPPAHILSLGSVNADFQLRIDRRPEVSETLIGSSFARFAGGKAGNVAFLARRLGVPALLLAQVGDDDLAEQALGPLRGIGVDLAGVGRAAGHPTGVAFITVPPDGKKGIALASNANDAWEPADLARMVAALRAAPSGSVLVADAEVPAGVLAQALRTARECGIAAILDPSPAGRITDALLSQAAIVTPNPGEAAYLTGIDCGDAASARRAAQQLRERGAQAACVKLPDGGCVAVDGRIEVRVSTLPVEVVDTTGAGDAFAGALAVALMEGRPLAEAVRFAVAASHLAVTAYGSQPAYPQRDDLERFAARLDVHVDAYR